jgi:hypothetical protein
MGSSLYLEVDTGERLRIIRQDRIFAGKALISFLNVFTDYEDYHQHDTVEFQWFKKLVVCHG